VKKAGMDTSDVGSYRLIANLSVLSKLFERVVAGQIWHHQQRFDLLPPTQSGFCRVFKQKQPILRVISDILVAVDRGDFAVLVLLDLSTAFNTVDHAVLLERSFGFTGVALAWLSSYLTECVQRGWCHSSMTTLVSGVLQGSVLGIVLFIMYTANLPSLVVRHGLQPHLYADDTQVHGSCRAEDVVTFINRLTKCVDDMALWMQSNRPQMNAGKTEYMRFTTPRRKQQLPAGAITIDGHDLLSVVSS
jgi:Reverse transcriptase (RNA-dependent DNA polymerase)